jgi:hypothetical protein
MNRNTTYQSSVGYPKKVPVKKESPYDKILMDNALAVIKWVVYSPHKRGAAINFVMGKKIYNTSHNKSDDISEFEKIAILALHPLDSQKRINAIKAWQLSKESIISIVVLHATLYIQPIKCVDMSYVYQLTFELCSPLGLSPKDFSTGMENCEGILQQLKDSGGW